MNDGLPDRVADAHDRGMALSGTCPLCRRGGWRSVGHHTARAHNVTSRALKEWLGVPVSWALTDPDVQDAQRTEGLRRGVPDELTEAARTSPRTAGLARDSPGAQARLAAMNRAADASAASRRVVSWAELDRIARRRDDGEQLNTMAAEHGISPSGLTQALQRLRRRRAEHGGSVQIVDELEHATATLARARAQWIGALEAAVTAQPMIRRDVIAETAGIQLEDDLDDAQRP